MKTRAPKPFARVMALIARVFIRVQRLVRPPRPCNCFGWKSVTQVYDDDQGEGTLIIDGYPVRGQRHTVKETCHVCGQTSLRVQTFPPAYE